MGKKTSTKSDAPLAKFEEAKIVSEIYESDMVKMKKENSKAMDKSIQNMDVEVK
jgi:hypothetical protein